MLQREHRQERAETFDREYQGFIEQGILKIARPEKGAKVLDTTTRADYKVTNGSSGREVQSFGKMRVSPLK